MRALKTPELGRAEVAHDVPIPSIKGRPGYVLVKTKYSGINPCDYLFTDQAMVFQKNITIGGEFSGVVVEVDPACKRFKPGDKIAGCTFPSNLTMPDGGCHAEYVLAKGDAMMRLDDMGESIKEEQAAGLGIAISTTFMALYRNLGLPSPGAEKGCVSGIPILIYGGSSNAGMMAIQFAKLSGMTVITTCSPANFELVKRLGADAVFDYHDPGKCAAEISRFVGKKLELVYDCIGEFDSPQICADVLAPHGKYVTVIMPRLPREDVTVSFAHGQAAIGEPFVIAGQTIPADPEAFEEGIKFTKMAEELIREGKIQAPPVKIVRGLENVPEVMQQLREWKSSASKNICLVSA